MLGAGHTEVPKEEAYKFYHHVKPCLSIVLRKGAARPRIGANREFTMPLVPRKSEALAAEPRARLSRRIAIGLTMVRGLAIASVRGEWILGVVAGFVGYGVGCAAALGVISDLVAKRQGKAEEFPHFRS